MEVEDVTRIRLAAWWAPKEEHHLPVGDGVLGEVVVDKERVLATVHEELADGAPRVWGQILQRRRLGGRGVHDGCVLQRARLLEGGDDARYGGVLLADGDVDALHVLVGLVDDSVEQDRGLASLPVTDDELPLPASNRDHGVDGFDTRLEGLLDRLAPDDAWRHYLHRKSLFGFDLTLSVEGTTQCVDDPAEHALADGHAGQLLCAPYSIAFLDVGIVAGHDNAYVVLFQVKGEACDLLPACVLELQHLLIHDVGKAVDARDAVPDLEDLADLFGPYAVLVICNSAFEYGGDLLRPEPAHQTTLLASIPSRRLSRRPRILPSIMRPPNRKTAPPISSGSTLVSRTTSLPSSVPSSRSLSLSSCSCESSTAVVTPTSILPRCSLTSCS